MVVAGEVNGRRGRWQGVSKLNKDQISGTKITQLQKDVISHQLKSIIKRCIMIVPYCHGLLVMILVQLRPSSIMGRPAELCLMIHLIDQHQIYHLLHKCQRILKGREYPGATIYSMDATLTRKSRKFCHVLNIFSDELLSSCCVLISEVKSDSLQKKLSIAVLRGGPLPGVFRLRQLHFHWGSSDDHGSEHVVNGVRYAGELHVLHWNPKYSNYLDARRRTDGVAVLAIFLQVGETPKPEMKRILEEINAIKTKGKEAPFPNFDPSILFPKSHDYWTYHGSFTTPPCEECVTWIILREPIIVSSDQMAKLRSLSKNAENEPDHPLVDNWRPTQPRYFRMVSASFL
ncbi:carbonic anhydrase 3-like isoform X1 [Manacus candei]|uniref:carbonic anhydrase 3-like isoform X1 n=1 Tax=Manacus candei TaxID=415023 RepID=UPI0022270E4A|nr:carbonic anhydrase 3-like isoform X1 [Manacus candei]